MDANYDITDMLDIYMQQHIKPPVAPTEELQTTSCPVNIRKSSLQLKPIKNECYLNMVIDSDIPFVIKIVLKIINSDGSSNEKLLITEEIEAGINLLFECTLSISKDIFENKEL
jgi:hypothetical protein